MYNPSITKQEAIVKAQAFFDQGYACSQSVLRNKTMIAQLNS